ncbi:hypothetical protein A9Q76_00390 [Arcobacter sp. 31_11_sub10_T18]|nr:hypothetical protein A9Q76_00390 [Arcobacter sp. 31_11_sub10_T18]
MAKDITQMSNSLLSAASRASFLEESRDEVCDVNLVYDTAKLKVEVLKNKDEVYSQLGKYNSWKVVPNKNMDTWVHKYINSTSNNNEKTIKSLKTSNTLFQDNLQLLVDANANKESNDVLNNKAKEVEEESLKIFTLLNQLKKDACKR